jgi:hypothetical protein
MSGHVRSPEYLRFTRLTPNVGAQPRTVSPPLRDDAPEPRFRNNGKATSPLECSTLNDAGAQERQLLRQIRDALNR